MPGLHPRVFVRVEDLPPGFSIADVPRMPPPRGVVMCAPAYFDVVDVKNEFMQGNVGTVDRAAAARQWRDLRGALAGAGATVIEVEPSPGLEDMVFSANPAFLGLDGRGATLCAASRMTHASRRPEVPAFVSRLAAEGYRTAELGDPSVRFEGGGDAVWHPDRHLIWGGHGWRTEAAIYPHVAAGFGAPVFAVELVDPAFYHLDTCFCALDERTVLVHAPAIASDGMHLIRRCFERVLEVDAAEAAAFACNATAWHGRTVVIDRRAAQTAQTLRALGYAVVEVDTGEFLKSGGSVYCMKNAFY